MMKINFLSVKKICIYAYILSFIIYVIALPTSAHELSKSIFVLDTTEIDVTTLDNIYKLYGKNKENKSDAASLEVCYRNSTQNAFVVFESGAMGGFTRITSIKIMTHKPKLFCAITNVDILSLTYGNGVRLGQI
ncbi:MAG: hypothetical protein V4732_22075 [Pseudomonadota bacterium]